MLKSIIFNMDTEWKLVLQDIQAKKRHIPLPGLRHTLQALAQENIHLSILSSFSRKDLLEVCQAAGIKKYFQDLISMTDLKSTEFPSAFPISGLLTLSLQKTGVSPAETLLITDTDIGVKAAKNATLPCIAFQNPHTKSRGSYQADILLESFDGLSTSFFFQSYHRFHGQPITIASTKRLRIRELTTKDIPSLCTICQNPLIHRFITDIADNMEEETARQTAYINTVYPFYEYGLWGIFLKNSNILIGRCGIENHKIAGKDEIMLSYLLDTNHWGKGYALEACQAVLHYAQDELDIHRIVAVIEPENKRSLRLASTLGMKPEREVIYKNKRCILFVLH